MRSDVAAHGVGEKRPGGGAERGAEAFGGLDEEGFGEIGGILEGIGGVEEVGEQRIEGQREQRGEAAVEKRQQRWERGQHQQKA